MHSRATGRRSASKCQGKWPDQTLDQAFGLPEVLAAVSTSRLSCKRAGKTRTLGLHLENLGIRSCIFNSPMTFCAKMRILNPAHSREHEVRGMRRALPEEGERTRKGRSA